MDDEERRRAFISDNANIPLAIADTAEAIRDLLRALAASDPSGPTERVIQRLRGLLEIWREDFPVEEVLAGAISRLKDMDSVRSRHGAIVDTTPAAMGYFAEITATDNFSEARLGKARRRYETDVANVKQLNELRRLSKPEHR